MGFVLFFFLLGQAHNLYLMKQITLSKYCMLNVCCCLLSINQMQSLNAQECSVNSKEKRSLLYRKKVLADKLEVPDGIGCATRIIRFPPSSLLIDVLN